MVGACSRLRAGFGSWKGHRNVLVTESDGESYFPKPGNQIECDRSRAMIG